MVFIIFCMFQQSLEFVICQKLLKQQDLIRLYPSNSLSSSYQNKDVINAIAPAHKIKLKGAPIKIPAIAQPL